MSCSANRVWSLRNWKRQGRIASGPIFCYRIGNQDHVSEYSLSGERWIEGWYNRELMHTSLNDLSPVEFEEQLEGQSI